MYYCIIYIYILLCVYNLYNCKVPSKNRLLLPVFFGSDFPPNPPFAHQDKLRYLTRFLEKIQESTHAAAVRTPGVASGVKNGFPGLDNVCTSKVLTKPQRKRIWELMRIVLKKRCRPKDPLQWCIIFLERVEGCCSFDTRICTEWSISHGRSWASNLIPWWRSHKAPRAVWGLATPHEVSWLEKASLPLPTFPNGQLCMPFGLRRHILCHNMIPQPLSPVVASN